ncbi:MAG TPA: Rne/Rng family ribonuclease [Jatrophihabitantaceae bacterium]|nr:Rne/Rng family ribonuclease [Jatrophihabitantaceae bacterium]
MLEPTDTQNDNNTSGEQSAEPVKAAKKVPAKKAAKKAPAKKAAKTAATKNAAADHDSTAPAKKAAKKTAAKAVPDGGAEPAVPPALAAPAVLFVPPAEVAGQPSERPAKKAAAAKATAKKATAEKAPAKKAAKKTAAKKATGGAPDDAAVADADDVREAAIEEATGARRRRRRGRRGRGGGGGGQQAADAAETDADDTDEADDLDDDAAETGDGTASTRRRRRRRRSGGSGVDASEDDPPNTVVHVREARADDGVKAVKGSTRLEAKRQRRRDGRETNRRRPPILTESEFLARREAVERVMAVRQSGDRTQIAVLEDDILVEHYVTRASATSYVGNVYLGRVQNVLPSMEAAFIDIGKGRNGVLYAGEVNWDAAGLEGKSRAIEQALKSGDTVLVQVTKDPIGHKGARLTSQVSLPGRFLVYVPGGGMTGISRKLPDTERHRLKAVLKKIVPEDAGVIVRTAAEGASEEELTRDVERLTAQWEKIAKKAAKTSSAPTLVHGEPDLAIRVVRDVFNEDFKKLVVEGDKAWSTISEYIESVAPDLAERVSKHTSEKDLFSELRVDEQLMKALDRKVWLPSGGSLVIDRTEAMTVIDVNTGKFVGSGGNLEQTVTRNNLEAAEEIVRQLRLRDVGGIVVIDFIDMVLESNRELVLRRLTECLGRDRTKHQVAEVTSLGLVQMTRKRVGEGLLEAFSEPCEVCRGRGVIIHAEPIDRQPSGSGDSDDDDRGKGKRKRGGKKEKAGPTEAELAALEEQRRAAREAITAIHRAAHPEDSAPPEPTDEEVEEMVASVLEAEMPVVDNTGALVDDIDDVEDVNDVEDGEDGEDADDVAEDIQDIEPLDDSADESEPAPAAESEPTPAAETELAPEGETQVPSPTEAPSDEPEIQRPAPRRRRSASRPAGPPVAVSQS